MTSKNVGSGPKMFKGSHYGHMWLRVSVEQISEFHTDVNKLTREEEI